MYLCFRGSLDRTHFHFSTYQETATKRDTTPTTPSYPVLGNKLEMRTAMENRRPVGIKKTPNHHMTTRAKTRAAPWTTPAPKSSQNLLLDLPTEIREEVYEYTFGDTPHFFRRTTDATVYALTSASTYEACVEYPSTVNGLPNWLLTNKLILAEAMDVFHRYRTYVFKADEPSWRGSHKITWPQIYANPLGYGNRGNIVNVEFHPGRTVRHEARTGHLLDDGLLAYYIRAATAEDERILSNIIDGLGENACLKLHWKRPWGFGPHAINSDSGDWLEDEKELFDCFDKEWNGRFRRVSITIEYCEKEVKVLPTMMKLAEGCSQRLVGVGEVLEGDVTVCWTERTEVPKKASPSRISPGDTSWERTLVLQRRV